jgi:PD-(D/E)XK nuclease superfamily protein
MPGNTRTGGVLEAMILPALDRGGYQHREQVEIGDRMGCGRHVVDAIAEKAGRRLLVSVKWQQIAGTAEQKFRSK